MKVWFYCGRPTAIYFFDDAPECGACGEIEVDEDEWNEGFVKHVCPKCENNLEQKYDIFPMSEKPCYLRPEEQ